MTEDLAESPFVKIVGKPTGPDGDSKEFCGVFDLLNHYREGRANVVSLPEFDAAQAAFHSVSGVDLPEEVAELLGWKSLKWRAVSHEESRSALLMGVRGVERVIPRDAPVFINLDFTGNPKPSFLRAFFAASDYGMQTYGFSYQRFEAYPPPRPAGLFLMGGAVTERQSPMGLIWDSTPYQMRYQPAVQVPRLAVIGDKARLGRLMIPVFLRT